MKRRIMLLALAACLAAASAEGYDQIVHRRMSERGVDRVWREPRRHVGIQPAVPVSERRP
jgi:hypothetical protein